MKLSEKKMQRLIDRAKKALDYPISRNPTAEEIAEKRDMLDALTRSTYCYEGVSEARTRYDGNLDLPTCDEDYHPVYLAVRDVMEKEYGHC